MIRRTILSLSVSSLCWSFFNHKIKLPWLSRTGSTMFFITISRFSSRGKAIYACCNAFNRPYQSGLCFANACQPNFHETKTKSVLIGASMTVRQCSLSNPPKMRWSLQSQKCQGNLVLVLVRSVQSRHPHPRFPFKETRSFKKYRVTLESTAGRFVYHVKVTGYF